MAGVLIGPSPLGAEDKVRLKTTCFWAWLLLFDDAQAAETIGLEDRLKIVGVYNWLGHNSSMFWVP